MKKNITVIRINKKSSLDNKYSLEKVARGYAFNYLIPNGLAEIATKGKIKHFKMLQESFSKKKLKFNQINFKMDYEIKKLGIIHLRKKYGNNNQIFGSISEQDIQDKIFVITGNRIDKKQIVMEPMKKLGIYTCSIFLNENSQTNLKIHILPYQV